VLLCAVLLGSAASAWSQPDAASTKASALRFEGYGLRAAPLAVSEASSSDQAATKVAYAGLGLRQNPEGVVVVAVQPGPLDGDGFKSPSIWRGDLIVSLNGQSHDVAGYIRLIRSLAPGDTLRVVYRRGSSADPYSAVPHGDPNGEERSVETVLGDAAMWRGTIGQGLPSPRVISPAGSGEFEGLILGKAEQLGLRRADGTGEALVQYLAELERGLLDPNSLPGVTRALERPLSLDRVDADILAELRRIAPAQPLQQSLLALHEIILRVLDVSDLHSQPDIALRLSAARREYEQVAATLLKGLRDELELSGPEFPRHLKLIRESPQITPLSVALLPEVARHALELERFAQELSGFSPPIPDELTERVRNAVEGPVLGARLVDGELWIVGGDRPNRYNMDVIAAIFDVGGADVYTYSNPSSSPYQIVIDQSGDDLYESNADLAGPAAAAFAVSVLHDRAGNDRYVSHHQGSIAAGLFGVAILIDDAGNDVYVNDTSGAGWSQGAAMYGAGMLIDRAGDDAYQAQILAQGVGGPGGIGLVVDAEGNDDYTANGSHFPSKYQTPGVAAGLSQGFGLGVRGYAAGGTGAIYDLAGDDRYSVGEFGQGSGYFQCLGILHDVAGNDRYVGSRYAQASAAHQAAGLLIDDAGNDSYTCLGPAAQAASWDQSTAMLIDRSGDDTYSAGELAQGAAAQQASAVLIDLDGRDAYTCAKLCLGESGDNAYHYDTDRIFSFSAAIDRGGKPDRYSRLRSDNETIRTGTVEPEQPASSGCCGMFVDE
jgi:hypothetical protein